MFMQKNDLGDLSNIKLQLNDLTMEICPQFLGLKHIQLAFLQKRTL